MLDWQPFELYQVTHERSSQSNLIQYLKHDSPPQGYPTTAVLKIVQKSEATLRECTVHVLLSRISPLLVRCYSFRNDLPGEYRLYLEHCELGSLSELYESRERQPWTAGELIKMWRSMAGALAAMHEANYVHRDVKAGNFFVTREGQVKLGDFGDARQVLMQDLDQLQSNVHGTITYFSSRQRQDFAKMMLGQPRTSPNATCFADDVFALGLTFCTMVMMNPNPGKLSVVSSKEEITTLIANARYPTFFAHLINSMRSSDKLPIHQILLSLRSCLCQLCDQYTPAPLLSLCKDAICEGCVGTYIQAAAKISACFEGRLFCPLCGSELGITEYLTTATPNDRARLMAGFRNQVKFYCEGADCRKEFAPLIEKGRVLKAYFRTCECGFQGCSWCQNQRKCGCSLQLA